MTHRKYHFLPFFYNFILTFLGQLWNLGKIRNRQDLRVLFTSQSFKLSKQAPVEQVPLKLIINQGYLAFNHKLDKQQWTRQQQGVHPHFILTPEERSNHVDCVNISVASTCLMMIVVVMMMKEEFEQSTPPLPSPSYWVIAQMRRTKYTEKKRLMIMT